MRGEYHAGLHSKSDQSCVSAPLKINTIEIQTNPPRVPNWMNVIAASTLPRPSVSISTYSTHHIYSIVSCSCSSAQ